MLKLSVCILVSLMFSAGVNADAIPQAPPANAQWYAPEWTKRQGIIIDASRVHDELTDYEIRVKVKREPEMQANYNDFRFTALDGSSELPFWVAKKGPDAAVVWVRVPKIPSLGKTGIYLYWGNKKVGSASDGKKTFEFFDDFSSDTMNHYELQDKDGVKFNDRIVWDGESQSLRITSERDSGRRLVLRGVRRKNLYVQFDLYGTRGYPEWWYNPNYSDVGVLVRLFDPANYYGARLGFAAVSSPSFIKAVNGKSDSLVKQDKPAPLTMNTPYTIGLGICNDKLDLFLNGEKVLSGSDATLTGPGEVALETFQLNCAIDNLMVAKYVLPAPEIALGQIEEKK